MAAEAIGLAFGAISLASLFQTCVQCYEYIDRGRTYSRDLAKLMTKLEIEKIRLTLWGEGVDVFGESERLHGVFERPQVRLTIHNLLNCIYMVFTTEQELRTRYGLDPINGTHDEQPGVGRTGMVRPVRFEAAYALFQRSLTRNQEGLGMLNRMRWAVRDWKKFSAMVDDLKSFNDGLEVITKSIEAQERRPRLMQAALITLLPDISNLRLVQEASTGSNDDWAEAADSIAEQSEVSTAAGHILDWRRDTDRGLISDDKSGGTLSTKPNRMNWDEHTLRGTFTKPFYVTTEICPSSSHANCCLTSEPANDWLKIDRKDEIATLLDENIDDTSFINELNVDVDNKITVYFYIYCLPCWISVWAAVRICRADCWDRRRVSPRWRIRIDEALDTNPDSARSKLQSFLERVQDLSRRPGWSYYIDTNHLRRRLYALENTNDVDISSGIGTTGANSRRVGDILKAHSSTFGAGNCASVVFLTTPEASHSFDALPGYRPFKRTPIKNEVYQFVWEYDSYALRTPVYLGAYEDETRYTESAGDSRPTNKRLA